MDTPIDLGTISVDPNDPPQPSTVDLPVPGLPNGIPAPEVAKQRTQKVQQGLGDIIHRSTDSIYQDFLDGKEQQIRNEAATAIDYKNAMARQQAIQDLATKQGGPLNPDQVKQIIDPFAPSNTPVDPASVIERAYATTSISAMNTAAGYMSDTNPLNTAQQSMPKQADDTIVDANELLTKNQIILSAMQDLQADTSQQSWAGWGADQAKQLFQPYVEYKERGNVDGIDFSGIGLGSNKQQQSDALYRKSLPEFTKNVQQIREYFRSNPSLGAAFLSDMLGTDTFGKTLDNAFTALAIPDAAAGVKGVAALTKKVVAYNQIRKAAKDMVSAVAANPEASPVTALEGAGAVGEAAVKKVTGDVVAATNGQLDPTNVARNTLPSTWQTMAEDFAANPGTYLSREEYTRLHDGMAKPGEDILNRIQTMVRVEDAPLATASEDVIRAYKDKIRNDFKGPPGMLADVEGPFIEPATNTKWYKNKLVDYDGEQFSDAETAKGRAESIGLHNATVEGTEANKVYLPEAAAKRLEGIQTVESGTTFKTAKGSTYEVNADGTTTRNKAARSDVGHKGDFGPKTKSEKTVYIEGDPSVLGAPQANWRYIDHNDGTISLATKNKDGKWGISPSQRNVRVTTEPKVGSTPLELWNKEKVNGLDGYSKAHFGNKITEVSGTASRRVPRFTMDGGVEIQSSPRPEPGKVPYNLSTGKFEATLTPEQARIEQQGLGFHIVQWVPMQVTSDLIRDNMIKVNGITVKDAVGTSSASGINSVKNSLLGWVRNSEDTLSKNESIQRKAATYAKSNVEAWAHELNKPLEQLKRRYSPPTDWIGNKLGKKEIFQQFERTLDASRKMSDPATGEPGYFFKSPGELQDFYNRSFNRNPSVLETEAYFNYVKVKEGERMFAEIAEFRNRARQGFEQKQLSFVDAKGQKIDSGFFDARDWRGEHGEKFPGGDDFILIMGKQKGGEDLKKLGHINPDRLNEMKGAVERGEAKVIELHDIDHHPLKDFSDIAGENRIRYVYTDNLETKPLQFNHVNKRGGAHFEWDYDNWIKQEDVRPQQVSKKTVENIYVGDKTIMPIKTKALGAKVTKLWNEAHAFIKADDWESAKPIVAKLGIDWNEFTGWYKPGRDANGKAVRPLLDANKPVHVVSKGKNINNIDNTLRERYFNFKDGTKTGSLNNWKVAYNTERHSDGDLRTINDIGTKDRPIFAHQPAEFVDPITTMNRSLGRAINSLFMDDYKNYGVEHWLREAEPWLEAKGGVREIRSAPFSHFNDPTYKSDINPMKRMNLETNRYKVKSFIGIPSKFDTWIHSFTEHLINSAYENYGPEGSRTLAQKARTIVPIWALHNIKNPVDFIRSATFNFKLGLFNPAQFLVQAQTHSLIWAMEPRHGTAGTYAMLLHGWSKVNRNPAILESLDNYATKLSGFGSRFRPGEFTEARQLLERTGFENVAGEYANLSKAYMPTTNFVQNDFNKGLRLGQTPFRLGEQSTRVTAWYTAFREFREANPTAKIGNAELGKILQKADLLTVNMSRASSSHINQGIFSLSTQFLSYQIKLAELFWSKRIGETALDRTMTRARIVTGFSLLYGLPNAVGVTGAPVSDNIRTHLMDDLGYIPGEHWWSTLTNEGFPAWSLAMMTGVLPNVGDRYGSQGWQNIKQAMRSDISWVQALGGASVSTMGSFVTAAVDPFWQYALSWMRGDRSDDRFTVRSADLIEPMKQISTISAGAKWWVALQSGKWTANNESYETDVSKLNATMLALTGMTIQDQDDAFLKNQMVSGEVDAQKAALKDAIKDWHRGIDAKANGDTEQGNAYHRNAMARLKTVGYPQEKINSFVAIANKGYEKAIDSAQEHVWQKGDQNKQQQRLEQYKRQLHLNDKRNQ